MCCRCTRYCSIVFDYFNDIRRFFTWLSSNLYSVNTESMKNRYRMYSTLTCPWGTKSLKTRSRWKLYVFCVVIIFTGVLTFDFKKMIWNTREWTKNIRHNPILRVGTKSRNGYQLGSKVIGAKRGKICTEKL